MAVSKRLRFEVMRRDGHACLAEDEFGAQEDSE